MQKTKHNLEQDLRALKAMLEPRQSLLPALAITEQSVFRYSYLEILRTFAPVALFALAAISLGTHPLSLSEKALAAQISKAQAGERLAQLDLDNGIDAANQDLDFIDGSTNN